MNKKFLKIFAVLMMFALVLTGCTKADRGKATGENGKVRIVTTTTMLKDLIENIGGDQVEVTGLMGEGVDPHLYTATADDVKKLKNADVVVYQGLHLEGKMGEIFDGLKKTKTVITAADSIKDSDIKQTDDGAPDPHIWFDIILWMQVGDNITKQLGDIYPDKKEAFEKNYTEYKEKLKELDKYVRDKVDTLTKEQRVLVTAHDAFSYFANRYGFEVLSIQGVSTESEATVANIEKLAKEISERKIKALFPESSVSDKTIKQLMNSIASKGHTIKEGEELYSDSLGDKEKGTEDFIKTVKFNTDTIVNSLK